MSRRFALWQADLDAGVCAAPEECVEILRDRDRIALVIEHRDHGRAATSRTFETTLRQDVEWQFGDLTWPPDLRPGALVTVAWHPARDEVVVRTTALDDPVRVDGVDYFHEYDPRVVTREFAPDESNRGQVLRAVRRMGRVLDDGSAVLAEAGLAAHCGLGRGAKGAFLLRHAVDQLIREGYLTRVDGSVDSSGYPAYPAAGGQKQAAMLFYAPLVEEAEFPDAENAERRDHWVNGFVRKLPPGAQPSEKQLKLHATRLEPGSPFGKKPHRGQNNGTAG